MYLTIFTPIYNRANIVSKLYDSLKRQTCNDFEWLIIDDGSTDNIKEVVEQWQKEVNKFSIRFYSKENGGKHTCINQATDLAKGELFFIVDSDDYLADNAVQKVFDMYKTIEDKSDFCGISGLRVKPDGKIIGTTFEGEYVDAKSSDRLKFNISGDKSEVFKTDILKKYKFPVFEGENFVTENVVWLHLSYDGYKIRWFNEPIYICEYLEGGLSDKLKKNELKNFYGDIHTMWAYMVYSRYSLIWRMRIYGEAYDIYLKTKEKDKKDFIINTFKVNKITLSTSWILYKIYNFIRRK